ncbi:hypothetical protein [Litoribacter populi]|uniref:hypothetical protein n=1 Tax=Litoribacter populi TaxID=2598460 RepID=UPI0011812693|nr:hypothetical protein [Litoribacter populi]
MSSKLIDFSKYETTNSKFTAELAENGGHINFSNSGKGGNKKFFTLSLESYLNCLIDIKSNLNEFRGHEDYLEGKWRDLGSAHYSDKPANAQCTVQTKPMFSTLSKIIMWANSPILDHNDPESHIPLDEKYIDNAITKLKYTISLFTPKSRSIPKLENTVFSFKSIREFAFSVFNHFYGNDWEFVIDLSEEKDSKINGIDFKLLNFSLFKRLLGGFKSKQTKDTLTSSNTLRYFEEEVLIKYGNHYYFTTQWVGNQEGDLSFSNLKKYFEKEFPEYLLKYTQGVYSLIKLDRLQFEIFDKTHFEVKLKEAGLSFDPLLLTRFISSIISKPFVILTGLSGSGKTKLSQAFVQWICQDESQYCIIPVGADWTNREPLFGYPNALKPEEYVKPDSGVLDLIIQAGHHPNLPHFLILDEMNLSHVERYFADFLSAMESKAAIPLYPEGTVNNGVPAKLVIPRNLFIIGTVNIDETTNMFSPKVLDRANTIEFRVTKDEMKGFLSNMKLINMEVLNGMGAGMAKSFLELTSDKSISVAGVDEINEVLLQFFEELKKTGAEFGYRSATEILRLINHLGVLDERLLIHEKIDIAIMQKLLPKLHGSRRKLCPILETLGSFCMSGEVKIIKDVYENADFDFKGSNVLYPISLEKIARMYRGAIDNGFASFAEA